ncbi:uncharacterized protein [Chelonus insularis]|uniref:uncharacterized protein n=1 Tax=Chelonus insularis TaxID=460826 RepID=UPI00158A71D3|nr:uncharacterized protein LOC118070620 [Chelonus insularis]
MKLLVEIFIVMGLIAITLAKPTTLEADVIDSIKDSETSIADEKLEATREKRGLVISSAYTVPVAYTAAYRTPVAYTSAYTYPYTYSAAYPYYSAAYSAPYYYV